MCLTNILSPCCLLHFLSRDCIFVWDLSPLGFFHEWAAERLRNRPSESLHSSVPRPINELRSFAIQKLDREKTSYQISAASCIRMNLDTYYYIIIITFKPRDAAYQRYSFSSGLFFRKRCLPPPPFRSHLAQVCVQCKRRDVVAQSWQHSPFPLPWRLLTALSYSTVCSIRRHGRTQLLPTEDAPATRARSLHLWLSNGELLGVVGGTGAGGKEDSSAPKS